MKLDEKLEISIGILGNSRLANFIVTQLISQNIPINLLINKKKDYSGKYIQFMKSQSEVAIKSDLIITISEDGPELESILFGSNGIARYCTNDSMLVDMSSVSPELIKEISEQLTEEGNIFLDATVINEKPVESGLIQMMLIGGDKHQFERCLPVFSRIAEQVKHVGENGASQFYRQAFAIRARAEPS